MTKKKIKVGVLYGGKTVEHEVSILSADNVLGGLDKAKYNVLPIKIAKNGKWDWEVMRKCDVIFPVLHGSYGEEGSVQGLLKLMEIPFVGAGILGSALGLDKDIMKRLLRDAGVPVVKFITLREKDDITFEKAKKTLGMPVFIKPANTGSSVGIERVDSKIAFMKAIKNAFEYDTKVLIEENIVGQELECSVLGNETPLASVVGEIVPKDAFYSYDAKYISKDGAELLLSAKINKKTEKKVQDLAIRTFQILNCEGMGRVDFLLSKKGEIYVNEINTIPGFTGISMYPKLWEETGLPLPKLLDRLIDLAFERFEKEQKLKTTYN